MKRVVTLDLLNDAGDEIVEAVQAELVEDDDVKDGELYCDSHNQAVVSVAVVYTTACGMRYSVCPNCLLTDPYIGEVKFKEFNPAERPTLRRIEPAHVRGYN